MSGAPLRLVTSADGPTAACSFGLDVTRYDRRLSLTGAERRALAALG